MTAELIKAREREGSEAKRGELPTGNAWPWRDGCPFWSTTQLAGGNFAGWKE